MLDESLRDWTVLLIGGPSSVGKSSAAKRIARQVGADWLQVDDLRLALQASGISLPSPDDTRKLSFFVETPDVWRLPPERLRDGFVGVGEALSPAVAKVVTNHLALADPMVLEGDGLLPSLLAHPEVRHWDTGDQLRAVFVAEPFEGMILANMLARERGTSGRSPEELSVNARASWLFGQWLADEARRRHLPVVESQPLETLVDRILEASRIVAGPANEAFHGRIDRRIAG
jgi:2-phosphoglycerate kinase